MNRQGLRTFAPPLPITVDDRKSGDHDPGPAMRERQEQEIAAELENACTTVLSASQILREPTSSESESRVESSPSFMTDAEDSILMPDATDPHRQRIANDGSDTDSSSDVAGNFARSLEDWWLQGTPDPELQLGAVEREFGFTTVEDLARALRNTVTDLPCRLPFQHAAFVLLDALSMREERSIPELATDCRFDEPASAADSEDDESVVADFLCAANSDLSIDELADRLRLEVAIPPVRLRNALARLVADGHGATAVAAALVLAELHYGATHLHSPAAQAPEGAGSHWPNIVMTVRDALGHLGTVLNGGREALCQLASRVAAQGTYLTCAPPLPPVARVLLATGLLAATQVWALAHIEGLAATDEYKQHRNRPFTALQVLSVALPLLTTGLVLGAACATGGQADALLEAALLVADMCAVNAIGRVLRELLQSWTRSNATAGSEVQRADGAGLSAREQMQVNVMTDALYTATSVLLLWGGPQFAKAWLKEAAVAAGSAAEGFRNAAMLNVFPALDAMCEAWSKPLAQKVWVAFGGTGYVEARGTQPNPGADPRHFLDHSASRLTTGPLADLFNGVALMAEQLGQDHLGSAFRAFAAVMNGLVGGRWRGRVIDYVTLSGGNPGGLLSWGSSWAIELARRGGAAAWQGGASVAWGSVGALSGAMNSIFGHVMPAVPQPPFAEP